MKKIAVIFLSSIVAISNISCSKKLTETAQEKGVTFIEIYLVAYGNGNTAGATEYRRRILPETLGDNQIFSCEVTKDSKTHVIQIAKEMDGGYRYLIGQRRSGEYASIMQGWTSRPKSNMEIARVFVEKPSPYRIFLAWGKEAEPGSLQDRITRELDDKPIDCVIHTP